ncbi:MAG: DUF2157 domain-containing protein [Acidimicrobiales bacterium]
MRFAFALQVLVFVGIIAAIGIVFRRTHHRADPGDSPRAAAPLAATTPGRRTRVDTDLERWVRAGLIDAAHAEAIAAFEANRHVPATTPRRPAATYRPGTSATATMPAAKRRIPVVAEALGYIGGILGTVGVTLLVQRSWADLSTLTRVLLTVGATTGLVVAGALVHERRDPALARLRWTLWLAATAVAGVFGWVLANDVLEVDTGELEAATIALAVTVLGTVLWWGRPRPLQQLASLGGGLLFIGTLMSDIADGTAAGVVLWFGGALTVLAGVGLITTYPPLTIVIGGFASMIGSVIFADDRRGWGLALGCLTTAVLLALAVARRPALGTAQHAALGGIGLLTLTMTVPQTIVWFADGAAIATGAVVWAIGATVLGLGISGRPRFAHVLEVMGGLVMLGGAAITGIESGALATLAGVVTAVGFVALGMMPGRVLMSVAGSLGLLIFVPWTISHFFPGEGRAPLLILVSGALLVGVAALLTRQGRRFRAELVGDMTDATSVTASEAGGVDVDAEEHPTEGLVQTR